MLRKLFIIAFLSVPFTTFAQNCNLIDNLIIPDTLSLCRNISGNWDTIRLELTDSTLLQATDTSLVFEWRSTHEWQGITTNPFFAIPPGISIADIAGTIFVRIEDTVNDCIHYDTITIEPFPFPQIKHWLSDTILCFGDTLLLNADEDSVLHGTFMGWGMTIGTPPLYSTEPTLSIIFDSARLTDDANIRLIAVFEGYCNRYPGDFLLGGPYRVFDTINISFAKPLEMNFQTDTIMCWEDGGFSLTALDESAFDVSHFEFLWTYGIDTVGQANTFTVFYEAQGLHTVKAWHEFCFRREIEEDVFVYDSIYFVMDSAEIRFFNRMWTNAHLLISDTGVCDRVSVTLNAVVELWNQTTYHWRGPNVDTTAIHDPVRTVFPGNFTVMLRDSAGCEREFSVNVRVEDCEPSLEMPNVFTPNGDNVNDYFRPIAVNRVYNFQLRIYNRQGRMVYEFEGDPEDASWRGWGWSTGAENAPVGTYFWAVRYNDIWGRIRREQGTVTLLR